MDRHTHARDMQKLYKSHIAKLQKLPQDRAPSSFADDAETMKVGFHRTNIMLKPCAPERSCNKAKPSG
eukprot:10155066-Ditylum_brightwellii.AAC.1